MRWLIGICAVLLCIAAGYVVFLNPHEVMVRLGPERTTTAPLAAPLLIAFVIGLVVVALAWAGVAGARGWRAWRARRRQRREARRAEGEARARDLVWTGEYSQARAELLRASDGVPTDVPRLELLAETYLHEGDAAGARALLERGMTKVGLHPRMLDLLAEAAERTGDLRGAADALERARHIRPESPRLARHLRDLYAATGRWPEALALQGDILLGLHAPAALVTEEAVLRGLRYQAALMEPDDRVAGRRLAALAREDRDFLPAWVSAGDRFARANRTFAARRTWERGARVRPAPVLLDRIAELHARLGRRERTIRLLRALERRHPDARWIPLTLARELLAAARLNEAEQVLGTVAEPLASQATAQVLRGDLLRQRGDVEGAMTAYARAAASVLERHHCDHCGAVVTTWTGWCDRCRHWNTFRSALEERAVAPAAPVAPAVAPVPPGG